MARWSILLNLSSLPSPKALDLHLTKMFLDLVLLTTAMLMRFKRALIGLEVILQRG